MSGQKVINCCGARWDGKHIKNCPRCGRSFADPAMETRTREKKATVCKDRTGYWTAYARDTGENIGGLHNTELEAYKAANAAGYIVA